MEVSMGKSPIDDPFSIAILNHIKSIISFPINSIVIFHSYVEFSEDIPLGFPTRCQGLKCAPSEGHSRELCSSQCRPSDEVC